MLTQIQLYTHLKIPLHDLVTKIINKRNDIYLEINNNSVPQSRIYRENKEEIPCKN